MKNFIGKLIESFGYKCIKKRDWEQLTNVIELRECDVRNCRVIASREQLLELMPKHGIVSELGVALGYSSEQIIKILQPKTFYSIDTFDLEKVPNIWGSDTKILFNGGTHEQYYFNKFSREISRGVVQMKKGLSWNVLAKFENSYFDFIYIDASHDYDSVKKDAFFAARKIKNEGYIMFNDYIMFDHIAQYPYGVIPVVNEMCVYEDFELIYFGLQSQMFCDVVLRRKV